MFFALGSSPGGVRGQEIRLGDSRAPQRQYVALETDAAAVKAGKPDWVELRFVVEPGKHINSHTPHDDLLVPTALEATGDAQLKVLGQEYPVGIPFRLDVGAGQVLSTFQGEFRVRVKVLAAAGETVMTGRLRYQACDARSCFPPRDLPLRVALSAR